jgi:hypothetical protein
VVDAVPGWMMHLPAVRGHIFDNNSICSDFRVLSYMHFTNHFCPALIVTLFPVRIDHGLSRVAAPSDRDQTRSIQKLVAPSA